jgi:hypothetical protein
MSSKRLGGAFAALALLVLLASSEIAAAETLTTEYSVTVRGFPVGRAKLEATFNDGSYSIRFAGGMRGLARLFSDAETTAAAEGRIGEERLMPADYNHVWTEDDDTETVAMHFSGRRIADMTLDPPIKHPERYAPFTKENTSDALDPVSAFVWPAAGGVTPETCNRTLPLVDGRRRFDISLAFDREEDFSTRDRSFHERTVVCRFSYTAVAGHRIDKPQKESILNGKEMEVWMAPAGTGFAAPARIQVLTRVGRIVLVATKFRLE